MEHVPCRALKIEVDQSHRTCIKILFLSFVVEFLGKGSKINLKNCSLLIFVARNYFLFQVP